MKKNIIQLHSISPEELGKLIGNKVNEGLKFHLSRLQPKDSNIWLTRKETAEMLGVSLVTLWSWTNKNILFAYKIGNQVRYKKNEVEAAMIKMA